MWEKMWARKRVSEWDTLKARLKLEFHPEGAKRQLLVLSELGCGQACVPQ